MSRFARPAGMPPPVILKPQDVAVLLKLVLLEDRSRAETAHPDEAHSQIPLKDLAAGTQISLAEIHNSLRRGVSAGLVRQYRREVRRVNLLELILHGVRYVFPATIGGLVRGVPTAYAAPPLCGDLILGGEPPPVWGDAEGVERGLAFSALYPKAPEAARQDQQYYELLALTDVFRTDSRAREKNLAKQYLEQRLGVKAKGSS